MFPPSWETVTNATSRQYFPNYGSQAFRWIVSQFQVGWVTPSIATSENMEVGILGRGRVVWLYCLCQILLVLKLKLSFLKNTFTLLLENEWESPIYRCTLRKATISDTMTAFPVWWCHFQCILKLPMYPGPIIALNGGSQC